MSTQHAQYLLLFLVLAVNFKFYSASYILFTQATRSHALLVSNMFVSITKCKKKTACNPNVTHFLRKFLHYNHFKV